MNRIKLLKVNTLDDGTIRLQSQLMVGKDAVDFIMQDGILKCWGYGKNGDAGFHEFTDPFEIVTDRKEMKYQKM